MISFSNGTNDILGSSQFSDVAETLKDYEYRDTVTKIAGLLTLPQLQANNVRLEILSHLACLYCNGRHKPSPHDLEYLLNETPSLLSISNLEDTPEDVFVSNIMGPGGNYRIMNGNWTDNDFYVQQTINSLTTSNLLRRTTRLICSIFSLLRLSEAVVDGSNLERWSLSDSNPQEAINISSRNALKKCAQATVFSPHDLKRLQIHEEFLKPFIHTRKQNARIAFETWGNSTLEKRPVVKMGRDIVLASPSSVGYAIRTHTLEWLHSHELLDAFSSVLQSIEKSSLDMGLFRLHSNFTHKTYIDQDKDATTEYLERLQSQSFADKIIRFDTDKYAHIVLVHENIGECRRDGIGSIRDNLLPKGSLISKYITEMSKRIHNSTTCTTGLTLVIFGGLGRGFTETRPTLQGNWHQYYFSLPSFLRICESKDATLLRLWKLKEYISKYEKSNINVSTFGSDDALFSYWLGNKYRLLRDEMSCLGQAQDFWIDGSYNSLFKKTVCTNLDRHAVYFKDVKSYVPVERLMTKVFFPSLKNRPIFCLLKYDGTNLTGLVESRRGPYWLVLKNSFDCQHQDFPYLIWDGVLRWLDKLLDMVDAPNSNLDEMPFYIRLEKVANQSDKVTEVRSSRHRMVSSRINIRKLEVSVDIHDNFFLGLQQPTNVAERELIEAIAEGIHQIQTYYDHSNQGAGWNSVLDEMFSSGNAREIHAFVAADPIDILSHKSNLKNRPIQDEDRSHAGFGLASDYLKDGGTYEIEGAKPCKDFLNTRVVLLWKRVRQLLVQINKPSVVKLAYENAEATIMERRRWEVSSAAIKAMIKEPLSGVREQEIIRSLSALASRVVIEMASAECPWDSGRECSIGDLDYLLANIEMLIDCALYSDAMHYETAEPRIQLMKSGGFWVNAKNIEAVCAAFSEEVHGESFNSHAEGYEELYVEKDKTAYDSKYDRLLSCINDPFRSEYGLSLNDFREITISLIDLAIDHESSVIISPLASINDYLAEKGINKRLWEMYQDNFMLPVRSSWDCTPPGFIEKDIRPWRYSRKLSVVMRPLIAMHGGNSDLICFGGCHLAKFFLSLIQRIEMSWMPIDSFQSQEMRSYIGKRANELGHEFASEVNEEMRALQFESRPEIEMTELGASQELGDIDVLAWRIESPVLIVIECKRLKPVKTIAEIAEQMSDFRGKNRDSLDKHLKRCAWIEDNREQVAVKLGIGNDFLLRKLVVTSGVVPMQFQSPLGDSRNRFITISELANAIQ